MEWSKVVECLKDVAEIFHGFLVPVIAVVAVYIAIQEGRTRRAQYSLNLFEKRFAVFKVTRAFLQDVLREGKIVDESAQTFWQLAVTEAPFLFEDDVVSYLKELREKCAEQLMLQERMYPTDHPNAGLPVGPERTKVCERNSELIGWFIEQSNTLTKKFERYLKCKAL